MSKEAKMNIYLTAKMKSTDEFYQLYDKKYLSENYDGKALIMYAIGNTNILYRYDLTNFLIDEGADVKTLSTEGDTLLHVLLGHVKHNLAETIKLCERLIELGVDINHKDNKNRLALQNLINLKYSDEELEPLYDLWFKQRNVDINTKNAWGVSPLELAQKLPLREKLVKRMLEYNK